MNPPAAANAFLELEAIRLRRVKDLLVCHAGRMARGYDSRSRSKGILYA
jgi:hypothetical protein